jgi:hypothetical protein
MEEGEEGKGLVAWLNGLAEVQAVLTAQFQGRPINEPNMTAWRQGGFEDWRQQQEALEVAGRLMEESDELGVLAQGRGLVDRAADIAALAISQQLMATRRMEDGAEKRRAVLKLVRGLVRLRKTERELEQAQREARQAENRREIHEHWAEGAGRRVAAEEAEHEHGHESRARSAFAKPTADRPDRTAGKLGRRDVVRAMRRKRGDPLSALSDAELMQRMEDMRRLGERTKRDPISHETHETHEKKHAGAPFAAGTCDS